MVFWSTAASFFFLFSRVVLSALVWYAAGASAAATQQFCPRKKSFPLVVGTPVDVKVVVEQAIAFCES